MRLSWLLAPSVSDLGFAARTTCAALLALTIALWMEMDSPQWAAMTVWIVAQNSRGQSLSKARWRLIGTFFGAVAGVVYLAVFPQSPWLLFPSLAIGAGLCCAWATFLRNFRSYALVLTAYTCVIIVLSDAAHPDDVFMVALSRATYIMLGVVCESLLAALFAPHLAVVASRDIASRIRGALCNACHSMTDLLAGQEDALARSRILFGSIPSLADQTEFSEIEMGRHSHTGDHARAGFAAISTFLARGFNLCLHMRIIRPASESFQKSLKELSQFLTDIPSQLTGSDPVGAALSVRQALQKYRSECLLRCAEVLTFFHGSQTHQLSETIFVENMLERHILETTVARLITELDLALIHYIAAQAPPVGDRFRFNRNQEKDYTLAFNNGIRAAVAICLGGILWEVTAWPEGATVTMFVAVTTTRFASFDNAAKISGAFLRGAVWAAFVAFFLVFLILPQQSSNETLLLSLFLPMLVGGLALRALGTIASTAASYGNFLPFMVGPANHSRMNEVTWFNTVLAVVMGIGIGILVFRTVLPFNPEAERWRLRRKLIRDLRSLSLPDNTVTSSEWIACSGERLTKIFLHAGSDPDATTKDYLSGAMDIITLGLHILTIRHILSHSLLTPLQAEPLNQVLKSIADLSGCPLVPAARVSSALTTLLPVTLSETNLSVYTQLSRALGSLSIMQNLLTTHAAFLDTSKRFYVSS